jgi:colanic acid/amylovoran biosynthesis glycosyltransferase
VVIGGGPLRAPLARKAAQLGVADKVSWLGPTAHAEVKYWMRRASIFCLPSCTAANGDAEGLGLVLLEAAASGVPVVATRHGGIPEAVLDGVTGLLVPERDAQQLAAALDALLSSPDMRSNLRAQARQFVQTRFDLFRQTQSLEKHYEAVL